MGFESFKPKEEKETKEPSLKLIEKMRHLIEKTPYSLKAALAIVALSAAMKQEAVASEDVEINPTLVSVAQKFEAESEDLKQEGEVDWHGYMEFVSDANHDSYVAEFPVLPGKGSGVFEMNSASVIATASVQDEAQLFEGLTMSYSVDSEEVGRITPTGETIEISVERDPALDSNMQIISEISNRLGEIEIQIEDEQQRMIHFEDEVLEESLTQNEKRKVDIPISEWEITAVTDESGQTTGWTISLQLGEIISE